MRFGIFGIHQRKLILDNVLDRIYFARTNHLDHPSQLIIYHVDNIPVKNNKIVVSMTGFVTLTNNILDIIKC